MCLFKNRQLQVKYIILEGKNTLNTKTNTAFDFSKNMSGACRCTTSTFSVIFCSLDMAHVLPSIQVYGIWSTVLSTRWTLWVWSCLQHIPLCIFTFLHVSLMLFLVRMKNNHTYWTGSICMQCKQYSRISPNWNISWCFEYIISLPPPYKHCISNSNRVSVDCSLFIPLRYARPFDAINDDKSLWIAPTAN